MDSLMGRFSVRRVTYPRDNLLYTEFGALYDEKSGKVSFHRNFGSTYFGIRGRVKWTTPYSRKQVRALRRIAEEERESHRERTRLFPLVKVRQGDNCAFFFAGWDAIAITGVYRSMYISYEHGIEELDGFIAILRDAEDYYDRRGWVKPLPNNVTLIESKRVS